MQQRCFRSFRIANLGQEGRIAVGRLTTIAFLGGTTQDSTYDSAPTPRRRAISDLLAPAR
jgi:hypothetical protein